MFRAHHVEHGSRIDARRHAEADARREIRLDQAGDHVDAGPLRRQHQMHADGARHLRQAGDALFDVGAFQHHQVGQLVDENQHVRNFFQLLLFHVVFEQTARL